MTKIAFNHKGTKTFTFSIIAVIIKVAQLIDAQNLIRFSGSLKV
jgi:hypothetical protein